MTEEPSLTNEDFYDSWTFRDFHDPPLFLTKLREPLYAGWKSLYNVGGGPCLFRTGADHIKLKDFRKLQRYVHAHICDLWYNYKDYYDWPLTITLGNDKIELPDEASYLTFLMTEESLMSWNTGEAEIAAMGNVLGVDIYMLTYNMQGRPGTQVERTRWNFLKVNPALSFYNTFRRNPEPLRILHDDEVYFSKLVWLPSNKKRRGPEIVDRNIPLSTITDSIKRRKKK